MSDADWSELEQAATRAAPQPTLGTLWFSMKGRIPRSTYWLKFGLPIFAIQVAGVMGDAFLGTLPANGGFGPFSAVVSIGVIYPGLVGAVKRLHDLGYPGWYLLVLYGGMFGAGVAAGIVGGVFGPTAALMAMVPALFLGLASFWFSVKMAFIRGTRGSNAYGRDPLLVHAGY